MSSNEDNLTEKDLENLTKDFGKPLPKDFKDKVFQSIRKKERLKQLDKLVEKEKDQDHEPEV